MVRGQLRREWPMLGAQLFPALLLLLGAVGVLSGRAAITSALVAALAELMLGVCFACWRAKATPAQAALLISVAAFFAAVVIGLKIFVHH